MSIPVKQTVTCPECGKPIAFTMWQSINTEMDFALPDIISGKLFEVSCKGCGFKSRVKYPILFNDMQHRMIIHYTTPDGMEESKKAMQQFLKLGYKCRIVTTQHALQEKARLLQDNLDDRVIELMKAMQLAQLSEQAPDKQLRSILYLKKEPGFCFVLIYDDRRDMIAIRPDLYDKVAETFRAYLDKDKSFVVDQRWAIDFMRNTQ